ESICRWGILGAAVIARKNWKAIRLSGNGQVVAVASRSAARAKQFIDECSAEVPPGGQVAAYGDYQALLDDDRVDAVYIPLPTGLRKEWVIKAAQRGKHVLCEKPVAVHADDAAEMIEACRQAGVQFTDGVMFSHSGRLQQLRDHLDDEEAFGALHRIQTHFSFPADDDFSASNIRAAADLEPHGALGDLGWYCIRFTLWAMKDQLPTSVSARTLSTVGPAGVPGELSAEMFFDDNGTDSGVTAGFFCSFRTSNQQTAVLSGEKAHVTLDDFVLPFLGAELDFQSHCHELTIDNCRWNFGRHTTRFATHEYACGESDAQEVRMVRSLADSALAGELNPRLTEIAMKTQQVLDACRRSAIADGQRVDVII
ncbi:MAG: Gfo/Idh/MocA family oxidoreductase, partial [Planctomycetota bacterium]